MTTPDEALARKLTPNERDALVSAMRNDNGRIGVVMLADGVYADTETSGYDVAHGLSERGLLRFVYVDSDEFADNRTYIYGITGRGRRVVRLLPEYSGKPLEMLWVKIAPNEAPNSEAKWISIDGFDIVALEKVTSVTDQFYMLKPHIPDNWHPVQIERVRPEGVER